MDELFLATETELSRHESTLHDRALLAAREFKRSEAELMEALIAVDHARVYRSLGYGSLFQYAVEALGLSEAVAYTALSVARKAAEHSALRQAVNEGSLGLSKAKKMLSVIQKDPEVWVKRAIDLPSRALEKEVARENPKAATQERAAYTSAKRLELKLGVSEELMLKLRKAQDQVSRSKKKSATLEETLEALTDFYLHHKDPEQRAKRIIAKKGTEPQTVPNPNRNNKPLKRSTQSAPNSSREPSAAQLHQVRLRDKNRCQHPGCNSTRFLDIHHIIPRSLGGSHDPQNLITLCKTHHQALHRRGHF